MNYSHGRTLGAGGAAPGGNAMGGAARGGACMGAAEGVPLDAASVGCGSLMRS